MRIRPVTFIDSPQIAEIYNYYVDSSHATLEIERIEPAEMEVRVRETIDRGYPFFICEEGTEIVGYAYGHQFRKRPAYRFSVEVSVYVRQANEKTQIGSRLYRALLSEMEKGDFHTVIAGISLPNDASVRLHENFGFEKVAHFREVGFKFGRWIDVGYWQKLLMS